MRVQDLVIGQRALLFTNAGSAAFTHVASAPFSLTHAQVATGGTVAQIQARTVVESIQFGDINGDGTLDLVLGVKVAVATFAQMWSNDGAGSFTMVGGTSQGYSNPHSFHAFPTLGDLDGDGDLDAFDGQASFINQGTSGFSMVRNSAVTDFRITPSTVSQMETAYDLGDIDGDGDVRAWDSNPCPLPLTSSVNSLLPLQTTEKCAL